MNKDLVMRKFLKKYGGDYVRKQGRWYWTKDNSTPVLVTSSFLLNYKEEPKVEQKVEPVVKVKEEPKPVKKSKPKKVIVEPEVKEEIKNEEL